MKPKPPEQRTEVLRVRLRKGEREALERIAEREDVPMSTVMRHALRDYIEGHANGRATRKPRRAK